MNARVLVEEVIDPLSLMGQEVVGDRMDLSCFGLVHHDVGQEAGELRRCVPSSAPCRIT